MSLTSEKCDLCGLESSEEEMDIGKGGRARKRVMDECRAMEHFLSMT